MIWEVLLCKLSRFNSMILGVQLQWKNFSGFLKLPFEIFAIAAPRSDFSCCWVLSGGFHRLDKVGIIFLLYGNVRTRKCVCCVHICHIKTYQVFVHVLAHDWPKASHNQIFSTSNWEPSGNISWAFFFFFYLIWIFTLLLRYITCNINITDISYDLALLY